MSSKLEQYVLMGIFNDIWFFKHVIYSELDLNISGEIMNFLIYKNSIKQHQSIIIYEINQYNGSLDVVYIRHYTCNNKFFTQENLKEYYNELITNHTSENRYIIFTDGEKYMDKRLDVPFKKGQNLDGFYVSNIHEIVSNKEFSRNISDIQRDYDNFQKIWNKIKENPSHSEYERCCNINIATFKVFSKAESTISVCCLSEGIHTYLPNTKVISLFDNSGRSRMFTFESYNKLFHMKKINVKGKKDIIYYDCNFFPTEEDIKRLEPYQII